MSDHLQKEQEKLYHLGLSSLSVEEYLALRDQGEIEEGGEAPTVEVFLDMIKRGEEVLKKTLGTN